MSGESRFITARDGLKLHVREFGSGNGQLPLVCLPGLTRTTEDFEPLAAALGMQRRVLALDYRGRGRSGYDANPANYTLPVELGDLLTVLETCAAAPAAFLGTSRGGLLIMLLASVQPQSIATAIFNDIGPVIERAGLIRIKSYVGRMPAPRSLEQGAALLRQFNPDFPGLSTEQWLAFARRTWRDHDGVLTPTYDPRLAETIPALEADQPIPDMWTAFDALPDIPLMVIRGANSDILSAETVEAMRARRPRLKAIEIADQGHAPLLDDTATIGDIARFLQFRDGENIFAG
ncbi:MAG: alpha/beta hydrolase [Pseudorhodoplanes sp.]